MNIPETAIEAAAEALAVSHYEGDEVWQPGSHLSDVGRKRWRAEAIGVLMPAAPFIAAQALRDAVEVWGDTTWQDVWAMDDVECDVTAVQSTVRWFRERATDLEAPNA